MKHVRHATGFDLQLTNGEIMERDAEHVCVRGGELRGLDDVSHHPAMVKQDGEADGARIFPVRVAARHMRDQFPLLHAALEVPREQRGHQRGLQQGALRVPRHHALPSATLLAAHH